MPEHVVADDDLHETLKQVHRSNTERLVNVTLRGDGTYRVLTETVDPELEVR